MRPSAPQPDQWKRLDLNDIYSAGMAANRFRWLVDYDPFVAMFSGDTRSALTNLFFSKECLGDSTISTQTEGQASIRVLVTLNASPMAKLLTAHFKKHLADLVVTAVFAGSVDTTPDL